MSRRDIAGIAFVYAPIVGLGLSVFVSLLCRLVAGRVVRVSRAWVVVAVAYGVWIVCGASAARGVLLPYTSLDGPAWAHALSYLMLVGLVVGLPIVMCATIFATGSQVVHTVAGLRGAQAAPDTPE